MGTGNQKLGLRETTALVIGGIIGADIYVCASYGAQYLGPAGLLAWAAAAVVALSVVFCVAQCAWRNPATGGPYAYVSSAFGPAWAFVAGWAQLAAELLALAAYPAALVRYLPLVGPAGLVGAYAAPVLVVASLTAVNYFGTVPSAKVNTALTVAKLVPLVLFIGLGALFVPLNLRQVSANLHPFLPYGWGGFGQALVLVFWAYAGFEHATFPAGEIRQPERTLPLALISGLGIATFIYLGTSFLISAVLASPEIQAAASPLREAFSRMGAALWPAAAGWAGLIMTAGALVSIAGADETGTLTTAWLIFALAADGHLPRFLARLHPRHRSPYVALLFQNAVVLAACLLVPLESLIRATTFLLGLVYLLTCAAAGKLQASGPAPGVLGWRFLPYAGIASCLLLLSQVRAGEAAAGLLLLVPPWLVRLALKPKPKADLLQYVQSRPYRLRQAGQLHDRFLARLYLWLTARRAC